MRNDPTPTGQNELPPFKFLAVAHNVFSPGEMDGIIAAFSDRTRESWLGTGQGDRRIRRSQVSFLEPDGEYRWLYERIWQVAEGFNERFFCVGIKGFGGRIQLARYDGTEQGYYDWHTDFGELNPDRKISISVQLSDPADYEGGDLELSYSSQPFLADRDRGAVIAFPSFLMHRVTPVTHGVRWSLVAWIAGPRWS